MFRLVFRNLSPDTVNAFWKCSLLRGFFFYYYKNLEIYEVGRLAILQKRDFAKFGYKRKSKVDFFWESRYIWRHGRSYDLNLPNLAFFKNSKIWRKNCAIFFTKKKISVLGFVPLFIIIAKWRNFDPNFFLKKMQLTQCKKIGKKETRKKNPPLR